VTRLTAPFHDGAAITSPGIGDVKWGVMTPPLHMNSDRQRTDADLTSEAVRVLRLHDEIPEQVQVAIDNGQAILTGTVEWYLQRQRAEDVMQHVCGVCGVVNHIAVAPHLPPPAEDVNGTEVDG